MCQDPKNSRINEFFTLHMKRVFLFLSVSSFIAFLFIFLSQDQNSDKPLQKEHVKVVIREVGHQLLMAANDDTSLVLPITELSDSVYELSFQNALGINPDTLLTLIKQQFKNASLPERYIAEVLKCKGKEVAYSFEVNSMQKNNIVPCSGRQLPKACYQIKVLFLKEIAVKKSNQALVYWFLFFGVFFLVIGLIFQIKDRRNVIEESSYKSIGKFRFYPEQNKLIKEAEEIGLSNKECEILTLLAENANQVVKREELIKKIWEDNGVVVGRSLDTYISKLRKKLKDDESIQLMNVHGVGYKLEMA